jgi:uncharacterized membrane protein HdeD (DUF308 family)
VDLQAKETHMPYALTPDEIAFGDAVTAKMEKVWGVYLAAGIVSVLFGFVVVSYRDVTIYALTYFASAFLLVAGFFQFVAGVTLPRHRWAFIILGVASMAGGVLLFAWPHITIFIVAIMIAWTFLLYGITDILHSMQSRHLPHWWVHLIRGILLVVIAFLALRHPGGATGALVILLGVGSVLFGIVEIFSSFSARHATRHWAALKATLG